MAITKVLNVEIKDNALDVSKDIDKLNKSGEVLEQTFKDVNATFEDVYGDLKPLTSRLGEAEDRLYELALAGKQNTQEYKELLQATANYRQVQLQTDLVVDTAAQTMSQKLGGALEGAASGFALVQGAMGLFGTESEEIEKALLKVQSAMALAQGIEGVRTALPLFTSLGTTIKTKVVTAFTSLKGAIMATGIGALVVAVGALIVAVEEYNSTLEEEADNLEKVNEQHQKELELINKVIDASEKRRNDKKGGLNDLKRELDLLKAKGATEEEIYNKSKAILDKEKQNLKVKYYSYDQSKKLEREAAWETYYQIKDIVNQQEVLDAEYTKFLKDQEAERKKERDDKKQIDIERAEERAKQLAEIERQRLINIQQLEQEFLAELEEAESGYFDSLLSEQEQEVRVVEDKYFRLKNLAEQYGVDATTLEEARLKEIADIQDKYRKEAADKEKEVAQEVADAKKDIQDAQIANVEAGISLLSQLAGDSRELQALSIAAENAVGIAKIIISTQAANAAAKLKYAAIPGGLALAAAEITANKVSAGIGIAASAAAAAKGIASLKQSVPVDTGGNLGGGGGLSNATQQLASPNFNVVGASGISQAESLAPVKAYVVSGDVTTAQALDRNRINNATF